MFCWHKWGMWGAPKIVANHLQGDGSDVTTVRVNIQDRTCKKCGKYQTRTVELK